MCIYLDEKPSHNSVESEIDDKAVETRSQEVSHDEYHWCGEKQENPANLGGGGGAESLTDVQVEQSGLCRGHVGEERLEV